MKNHANSDFFNEHFFSNFGPQTSKKCGFSELLFTKASMTLLLSQNLRCGEKMVEYGQTPHIGPICINKTHKIPTLKTHKISLKFCFIEILQLAR